jgi:hypothetical protein
MRNFTTILVINGLYLVMSSIAVGNPVSCEVLRLRQTPKSRHVQVTFGDDCSESEKVVSLTRDGQSSTWRWSELKGFTTNTGSGLDELGVMQTCDCDVAVGEHTYKIAFKNDEYSNDLKDTITVVAALPEPDAGGESGDTSDTGTSDTESEEPWSIPDPVEIQGLDCIDYCNNPPGPKAAGGGSGCSAAGGIAQSDGSPVFALLSLLLGIIFG